MASQFGTLKRNPATGRYEGLTLWVTAKEITDRATHLNRANLRAGMAALDALNEAMEESTMEAAWIAEAQDPDNDGAGTLDGRASSVAQVLESAQMADDYLQETVASAVAEVYEGGDDTGHALAALLKSLALALQHVASELEGCWDAAYLSDGTLPVDDEAVDDAHQDALAAAAVATP